MRHARPRRSAPTPGGGALLGGQCGFGARSRCGLACRLLGRVRGVDGLYVADASLMPTIPSSNIHLPVLMIVERVAAWLRDE